MAVFRWFRRLVEALEALTACLVDLVSAREELGPALERLDALERSRHHFEAQVEGTLLKAEGKLSAASNAEARERQLKRSYERIADRIDSGGEEESEPQAVFSDDAAAGKEERVHALRLAVAPNSKAAAVRAKFGMG